MKKIFAIALAVVMVLSMASAFALSDCYANFAWPCDPDKMFCGRGTVEIVPVVKVNNGCGGFDYQINTCAGAVADDEVYYIIKLNVDANPDAAYNFVDADVQSSAYWWDAVEANPDHKDDTAAITHIDITANKDVTLDPAHPEQITFATAGDDVTGVDWDADKAKSYYYINPTMQEVTETEFEEGQVWVDVTTEDLNLKDVVFEATLAYGANAAKTKICAEIVSYDDGYGTWVYGDYVVIVDPDLGLTVTKGDDWFAYGDIVDDDEDKIGEGVAASSDEFAAEVNKLFNLNGCTLGTCLTAKNVEKNFGWKSALKECFSWSADASAIVDADCVVAIPKTGDASLLWWLF